MYTDTRVTSSPSPYHYAATYASREQTTLEIILHVNQKYVIHFQKVVKKQEDKKWFHKNTNHICMHQTMEKQPKTKSCRFKMAPVFFLFKIGGTILDIGDFLLLKVIRDPFVK